MGSIWGAAEGMAETWVWSAMGKEGQQRGELQVSLCY